MTRDGTAIGSAQWGVPVPTDPGTHEIAATAPGRERFATKVDVHEGANEAVVPALKPAVTSSPPTLAAPPPPASSRPPPPPVREAPLPEHESSGGLGTQKTLALAAGGVGVVGVVVGSVFGLKAKSKHDDAAPFCNGNTCTQDGVDLRHDAVAAGNLSTVFFAVGIAGLAGGAALWLTAHDSNATTGVRVVPAIGSNQGGAVMEGEW